MRNIIRRRCGWIVLILVALGAGAEGGEYTWNGAGSDSNASSSANWLQGDTPHQAGDVVRLDGTTNKDMIWDLTNSIGAWYQTADYTGTVTIATRYDALFPCLTITGDCQVLGGKWTQIGNPAGDTEVYRLRVEVGGDFTLAAAATIDLDQKGYAAQYYGGYGPGAFGTSGGNYSRGSSHGGLGGEGEDGTVPPWSKVYGSIVAPTNLGSSSAWAGGGAIQLGIARYATIDGTITADGQGAGSYQSASAGGSIYITAASLAGYGSLNARGGSTYQGGAGGGGRIAVILSSGTNFGSLNMLACGGLATARARHCGAAGSIYRQIAGQASGGGSVAIDNNNIITTSAMTMITPDDWDMTGYAQVVITNRGFLALNTNTMLDWVLQTNLSVYGPAQSLLMAQRTNGTTLGADFELRDFTLYIFTNLDVAGNMLVSNAVFVMAAPVLSNLVVRGDLRIATNGTISHWLGGENYRLDFHVGTNLIIDAGGAINLNGLGFAPGTGPGAGSAANANSQPAASHGGLGAPNPGIPGQPTAYGSFFTPTNYGSGAYVYGGGAIALHVGGTSTIDGVISALASPPALAVGAGGSILLETGWLNGGGTLNVSATASGFWAEPCQYAGGGGRIAVILTKGTTCDSVQFKAYGGYPLNTTTQYAGAAGTVYLQTAEQGARRGILRVDNRGVTTPANITTPIPANIPSEDIEAFRYVKLMATNSANVELLDDMTMGDLFLCDDSVRLRLNGHTLQLKAAFHDDWGTTNRVVYDGGCIVWALLGSTFFVN